jgi:hypothetical protein
MTAPNCIQFQFETVTDTFFRNVPFHPVDFDTLEIEIQKTPAIIAGVSICWPLFADRTSANGFGCFQVLCLDEFSDKSFGWTILAIGRHPNLLLSKEFQAPLPYRRGEGVGQRDPPQILRSDLLVLRSIEMRVRCREAAEAAEVSRGA